MGNTILSFDTSTLKNITTIFNPTASKVRADYTNLKRHDGWTTNGFWMLQTKYEPNVVQKINDTGLVFDSGLVLNPALENNTQMYLTNDVKLFYTNPCCRFCDADESNQTYINAYFVAMLGKLNKVYSELTFYIKKPTLPLVIRHGKEAIGLIMPFIKRG
jgi:hypothetical protein